MQALALAASPPPVQPTPLVGAAASRVYRNGAWRNRPRGHGVFSDHVDRIETGAFGPPPVAGPADRVQTRLGGFSLSPFGSSFGL